MEQSAISQGVPDGFRAIPFDKREAPRDACVYCLHKLTKGKNKSRDHLPPDKLFPENMRNLDMRTVPCCKECNNSFSEDDEWFRNIMAAYCANDSDIARKLLETKVKKSGEKKPHLLKKKSAREEWINLQSPSGIYYERRKEKMPFTKDEEACITRMLHRLCKGYYWVLYKKIAPLNTRAMLLRSERVHKEFIQAMGASQWISSGNPDVFMWTALPFFTVEEPLCFYWFTFYKKFSMIVLFHMDTRKNIFGQIPSSPLYVPQ